MLNSNFQFTRPVLVKSEFQINTDFKSEAGKKVDIKINASVDKDVDVDNRTAIVALAIELGERSADYPFYISVKEQADFRWDESLDDKHETLLQQNAPALLLGYIRQVVVEMTAASPYPVYHIPFIDFTKNE